MIILKEDCPKEEGNDRTLPYSAYVVEYKDKDGGLHYDISLSDSAVELFDHYYDKFKKDFIRFFQSEGRANPKLWKNPADKPKEGEQRKRRRRQG